MSNTNPDTAGDPQIARGVAAFAEELRRLRADAGSPSFRQMARAAHYAPSTLVDAVNGRRLPSESVVRAFVLACGGDPEPWAARLAHVVRAAGSPAAAAAADADAPTGDRRAAGIGEDTARADERAPVGFERSLRRVARRAARARAALFVLGLALGIAAGLAFAGQERQSAAPAAEATAEPVTTRIPTSAPTAEVGDGADPGAAGCDADARLVDRSPVMNGQVQVGALDLLFSPHCGAGWARLYLYPGQPTMFGYVEVRADDGRESSIAYPLIKQVDDYTDVVVPAAGGCLGATATVYEVGRSPMHADIRCQAAQSSL